MSRPTDEKKDKLINLRISNDMCEELSKRGDNLSQVIRELLKDSMSKNSNTNNSVIQPSPADATASKNLISMLNTYKKSPSEFVADCESLLESGSLIYENGKLRVEVGFDYDPFLEFCRKHNARPKKVFENIMDEIYKEFGRN